MEIEKRNGDKGAQGESAPMPKEIFLAQIAKRVDWKRLLFIFLGLSLFCLLYFSPGMV